MYEADKTERKRKPVKNEERSSCDERLTEEGKKGDHKRDEERRKTEVCPVVKKM